MASHPHQSVSGDIITNNRTWARFAITVNGTLNLVDYRSDTPCVVGVNFNLKKNGVSIYATTPDRPAMADGDTSVQQAENVSVVIGDRIDLSVTKLGSFASVGGKLYGTVYVEDGIPTAFGGTSSTSFSIGTGSKAFTVQSGLAYSVGSRVRVASAASPTTTWMEGIVTAYSGTTLTMTVDLVAGTGTHTDWRFSLAGNPGAAGATGATGSAGSAGVGVPTGGSTGQVLTKNSGTNYDTGWATPSGGGGAAALDDLTDVDTVSAAPTTGDVLEFNGTLWVPAAPSGGGGGSLNIYTPDAPYASPGTVDDEFTGGSLDAKWATLGTIPTLGFATIPSHLSLSGSGGGTMEAIVQTVSSSADETYRMKIVPGKSGSIGVVGFVMKDVVGNYFATWVFDSGGTLKYDEWINTSGVWNNRNSFTISAIAQIPLPMYLEVRYVHSSPTYYVGASFDGITFYPVFNRGSVGGGSLDKIGISSSGSSGGTGVMYVDWFRKLQGAYTGKIV